MKREVRDHYWTKTTKSKSTTVQALRLLREPLFLLDVGAGTTHDSMNRELVQNPNFREISIVIHLLLQFIILILITSLQLIIHKND